MGENSYNVTLQSGRQITIPFEVAEALRLGEGDQLELTIKENGIFLKSRKQKALETLDEIHRAFADSDITEEELQEDGRRIREKLAREKYGVG
ncbi:MAG: AbrB/MazE/SpoVT family DNA-binding domain-containing protein [Chloroflexi bacterium]|nr:AbrB/MazE/SpoVT family DNA-binding domain-containing protein [Chloroflexota bacterium]